MVRKGITPVIAVLLLLMMTVAAAGGAYVWMQNLQESIQERSSERFRSQTNTNINIVSLQCHDDGSPPSGQKVEVLLKNAGSTKLDLNPVDMNVRDASTGEIDLSMSRSTMNLNAGSLKPSGTTINPGSEDFSSPGERTNYLIPLKNDNLQTGQYYSVEFVFTDVASGLSVSGECQASVS